MVFFTCNGCGESLKKVQVEKHVVMCRSCTVLSCVDCGTDFWGDDYKTHTKCISEDQKYGGKGYEAKANKGDVKQQQWIQRVHEAMNKPGVSAKLKDVLRQVSAYDNVPRKKAKFQNWMKNSLRITNQNLHDEVWEFIAAADKAQVAEAQETTQAKKTDTEGSMDTNGNGQQNGHPDSEKSLNNAKNGADTTVAGEPEANQGAKKKKKDKKRKHNTEEDQAKEENVNGTVNETSSKKKKKSEQPTEDSKGTEDQHDSKGTFNWRDTIEAVLRESPDQELPLKKLRKKVLAAYSSFTGDANCETEVDVVALFHKKLDKNPEFRIRLVN